jgi:peroxiredoxin
LSLQIKLDAITEEVRRLVQPERLEPNERAVADLRGSDAVERILPVGEKAPEFSLPDHNLKLVRSSDLFGIGRLVIKFFRGRWCPYCMTELETYAELYPRIRDAGGLLIAISPQTVRQNDFAVQQYKFRFPLLHDAGNAVSRVFGLVYKIPEYHQQHYSSVLINLPFINGDKSWELPLPATYVIDTDRTVLYASAYADFRKRPDPDEVLQALTSR